MKDFSSEFNTLNYVIKKSSKILLFVHRHPDGDTIGSALAFKEYLENYLGKEVDITCFDPIPDYFKNLTNTTFEFPDRLNLQSYDSIIACDSVERGFDEIVSQLLDSQAVILIDHHPDITLSGDINIIDFFYSSVCEIIYDFFEFSKVKINSSIATSLMIGILGDTGNFQHSNTTPRVMEVASDLMKKGASFSKIIESVFANKKISTLKLWGIAFEKAKINPDNRMITTMLTLDDLKDCDASTDDIAQVASILNTVPGTKFSLVLSERENGKIKGSLRSEEYKGTDVSAIAQKLGGGGHKLASGFEVRGKIVETESGWEII
ncbi:bifunctional oligoribonuclease and PAP phosphatase NrnA [bacterium BMS3Abin15]|nr:bifunctional oligoribonuclease and PAP phosphatase NrnA [bacterium BMS3Abin15]HDH07720.1 bifunctional oligoribonuclease/PAP phosphatase NrnA [Candidatus Moranbacteria bacterium]